MAKPSFLSYHLDCLHKEENETQEELHDIKGAAAGIYGTGTDSVSHKRLSALKYPIDEL